METKHTPLPWEIQVRGNEQTGLILSQDPMHPVPVCDTGIAFFLNRLVASGQSNDVDFYQGAIDQRLANAAFIVDACNNYDRLKAERDELRNLLKWADSELRRPTGNYIPMRNAMEAALAKLEKEGNENGKNN